MTQPKIEGVGHGKPVMPFGSTGAEWIAFLIDALGHLQVDVVSAALGSGGATETTLLLIKGYVDTLETLLSGGLPAALDSGALKTKEQSPLTGFATSANQATMITALQLIDDLRAALDSVATDELDVHVEEFDPVPSSPVNTFATWIDVPTATSTTIVSYTVTNGKTFYLTDIIFTDAGLTAGVEIRGALKVAGGAVMDFHVPAGGLGHFSLRTPIKATSAQVVLLEGYQWSGGNKRLAGNLIGFEV